jgi:hypothetical protein
VFGLAVTDLVQQLYPYLRVGPASVRRCAVIPFGLGLVPHGDHTESEGSYEKQKYAGNDVRFPFLPYERT